MQTVFQNIIHQIGSAIMPFSLIFTLITPYNTTLQKTITTTPGPTSILSPTLTPTHTPIPTLTHTPTPTRIPTPTVSPSPSPIPITSEQLDGWFTKYSNEYSVDRNSLWKIAVCESNLRVQAVNGIYGGLYQYSPATWKNTRKRMNLPVDPDLRFHPEEAIRTAAFTIATSGLAAWPNCSK